MNALETGVTPVSSGSAIRGSRVGSSPMRPDERSEPAPRREVTYWCAAGHAVEVRFAADVVPPETWDCTRCGQPGGLDREKLPGRMRSEPYKSHLAYVKERRSDGAGAPSRAGALARFGQRRARSDWRPTRPCRGRGRSRWWPRAP